MELRLEGRVGLLGKDMWLGDLGHLDGAILKEGRGEGDHGGRKAGDLVVGDGSVVDVGNVGIRLQEPGDARGVGRGIRIGE